MNPFRSYISSFMLFLFLLPLSESASELENKVDVRIINNLGNGLDLGIHCKSKNDDLGNHILASNQLFEFRFRPNFWGSTLYFCKFWWTGESHWFDIYVQNRDKNLCDSRCWWMVAPAGPCLLRGDTGVYDLCAEWNGQQLEGFTEMENGEMARTSGDFKYFEGNGEEGTSILDD